MSLDEISVRIIEEADSKSIIALYKDANWWQDDWETGFVEQLVSASFLFAGAFAGERMIGMGRVISDGISDGYIQDVIVHSDYRNQGIGGRIVDLLTTELRRRGVDWIGLIGEPGTEKFYKRHGFSKMPDYIPMKLDN